LGKSHACEGVPTTLLGITGHGEGLLWLTPFQQRQGELIRKRVFSVNAAVVRCNKKAASASVGALLLCDGASRPYFGANIVAKLRSMPRITTFVLLLGVGLSLLSCTKKIDGDTSFKEASKGFQKELTKDQRKSAIEQLQTETAGKQ
jgi:hypothetical protein